MVRCSLPPLQSSCENTQDQRPHVGMHTNAIFLLNQKLLAHALSDCLRPISVCHKLLKSTRNGHYVSPALGGKLLSADSIDSDASCGFGVQRTGPISSSDDLAGGLALSCAAPCLAHKKTLDGVLDGPGCG